MKCSEYGPGAYARVKHIKYASLGSYSQTLDQAGKAYQKQTLWLSGPIHNLRREYSAVDTAPLSYLPSI